jgi:hypothetical protein
VDFGGDLNPFLSGDVTRESLFSFFGVQHVQ